MSVQIVVSHNTPNPNEKLTLAKYLMDESIAVTQLSTKIESCVLNRRAYLIKYSK